MALLTLDQRKAIFKYLGLGEYNKNNIQAFQKKYMLRKSDWDGIYGENTDNTLRTVYYTKLYTKNFKPEEFRCECGGRYCCGYPSYMKPAELIHIQAIRDHYNKPITVTCGLRCKTWNSKLGGSIQNSLHMQGLAIDFFQSGVTDPLSNRKNAIKWIKSQPNQHYTYGNGINSYGSRVSAPYMGNCLHTDCYDNVKPKYPKWEEPYLKVIDVSDWQRKIDWKKVKADGVVGAIIRYADGSTHDARFDENMKNAKAAGLHIGCYIFSRSSSKEGGETDATRLYNAAKKYSPDMPLFIDLEARGLEKYADTVAIAFLNKMKSLGAKGGVYANLNWWNNYLKKTATEHANNAFWIAQYNKTMDYKPASRMGMWQYSSDGSVDGISGRVDMNKCYIEYWKNTPKEKSEKSSKKETPKKSIDEIAKEVIAGKWGDGNERVKKLKAAGYDAVAVQKKVNALLAPKELSNREKLAKCANDFAYATNTSKAKYPSGAPKAAYKNILYKVYPNLKNMTSQAAKGASCDVFVGTCVRAAGIDKDFPRGLSPSYLAKSSKFKQIDKKDAKPGDIIVTPKHICIAWSDGKVKEASNGDNGFWPKTTNTLTKRLNASGAKVYRAK